MIFHGFRENDLYFEIDDQYPFKSKEEIMEEFLSDVLYDFSEETGIGNEGQEKLLELNEDIYLDASNFGIKPTGILDLYMLTFKLAKEQLDSK